MPEWCVRFIYLFVCEFVSHRFIFVRPQEELTGIGRTVINAEFFLLRVASAHIVTFGPYKFLFH